MSSRRAALDRKKNLSELTRELLRLRGQVGRDIYHMGRILERVSNGELWRDGGYDSFVAYLRDGLDISRATAFRFMRIARHFNAEIANRYGMSKLDAAISYLGETPDDEKPGDLLAARIRIRGQRGRYRLLSLHEATATQIREATAHVRESKVGAQRIPRAMRGRVGRLADALPEAPPGTRSGERVRVMRGDDGRLALSFQAIPLDELDAFVKAVRRHLG